jgi:hypothetical protein
MTGAAALAFMTMGAAVVRAETVTVQGDNGGTARMASILAIPASRAGTGSLSEAMRAARNRSPPP